MPLPVPATQSDIDAIHSARRKIAFERARSAPFHRDRLAGIDPDRLDDPAEWAKIPILEKEALRDLPPDRFQSEFFTGDPGDIMEFWRSGGATGVPLFYPRTAEDMKYGLLSFDRIFDCAGLSGGPHRAHVSFPLGIHPVGHVFCRVAQGRGIGVNWAGSGASTPSAVQVELIETLKPTIWLGMGSYALHLANLAEAGEFDLAGGSVEYVFTTAEPLSQAKRDKIERMWGATVFDGFGMTEAGMMGGEDAAHDGFRIWTDLWIIEVLDPDSDKPVAPGDVGKLVVTPLWTNNATPFIRWSSGDLVSVQPGGTGTGPYAVFPVLRHAHRTSGFFKVRGVNINHSEFEDFMFAMPDVNDFKAEVVTSDGWQDVLRVSFEARRGSDAAALAQDIAGRIKVTFESTPEVKELARGTLAHEFEGQIKAQRFIDQRGR